MAGPTEDRNPPVALVRRSGLDPDVWYCVTFNYDTDQSDWEIPGRVRAVKQYAAEKYGGGTPVRWLREDNDTWLMPISPDLW